MCLNSYHFIITFYQGNSSSLRGAQTSSPLLNTPMPCYSNYIRVLSKYSFTIWEFLMSPYNRVPYSHARLYLELFH